MNWIILWHICVYVLASYILYVVITKSVYHYFKWKKGKVSPFSWIYEETKNKCDISLNLTEYLVDRITKEQFLVRMGCLDPADIDHGENDRSLRIELLKLLEQFKLEMWNGRYFYTSESSQECIQRYTQGVIAILTKQKQQ